MYKYDGFLFGNGMTLNLLSQLKTAIPLEKQYLIGIDDFLKSLIENKLSKREERQIFHLFYRKNDIENHKNFERLKDTVAQYYKAHDANIEYYLGVDLFQEDTCGYDYTLIKSIFPFLYNIWHELLIEYLYYLGLDKNIEIFMNTVNEYLNDKRYIFTTNFDRFADSLNPAHLHGKFVTPFKKCSDLVLKHIDESHFIYKCIWGWNGIGKLNFIDQYKKIIGYDNFFNFNFFYDSNAHVKHLLIYGIGFQISGYIEALSTVKPEYKKPTMGGVVDEHILIRLQGLQTQHQLEHITFTYYADSELQHLQELVELYGIKNVMYKKSSAFLFSIT